MGGNVLTVEVGFEGCGDGVSGNRGDLAVKAPIIEPVEVLQGGELDIGDAGPWCFQVDQLPLVEPVEALGYGVVIAVVFRPDRRDNVVSHDEREGCLGGDVYVRKTEVGMAYPTSGNLDLDLCGLRPALSTRARASLGPAAAKSSNRSSSLYAFSSWDDHVAHRTRIWCFDR